MQSKMEGKEIEMGKPTGFMEYKREVSKDVKPKERIKNFHEFHQHLPVERQDRKSVV